MFKPADSTQRSEGILGIESLPIYRMDEPPRVGIAYLVNDEIWTVRAIEGAVMTIQRRDAPVELRHDHHPVSA